MTATELAQDGSVIWTTLAEPGRGLAQAVTRRRALTAVLVSTFAALVATAIILPQLDVEAVAAQKLKPDMTPHERTEAIETAVKLHHVVAWASAAAGPTLSAFLLACFLWVGFWTAGAKTGFKDIFTVSAHGLLPNALQALLTAPAAVIHAPVNPTALAKLLPSSVAALLPASLPAPVLAAASSLDLFTLWALYLTGSGMAKASGASRRRAFVVVTLLFVAYVALFKIAPSAAPAGGPGGPRGGP
jgi:hypothetical protein